MIKDVKACGPYVLVEHLSAQEAAESKLTIPSITKQSSPQAYIVDIGPGIKKENYGFEVGDRVLLQGSFVPVPHKSEKGREMGVVSPTDIKAILVTDCCKGECLA